ncbi:MAG: sensor histidine kinase [Caulobacteraceae bacterium]
MIDRQLGAFSRASWRALINHCERLMSSAPLVRRSMSAKALAGMAAACMAASLHLIAEPFLHGSVLFTPFLSAVAFVVYVRGSVAGWVALTTSLLFIGIQLCLNRPQPTISGAVGELIFFVVVCGVGIMLSAAIRQREIRLIQSEREKSEGEAKYRLLAREFEHRLSNNIAVMSAMALMSSVQEGSAKDMLNRLQPRFAAYGRAQHLLLEQMSNCVHLERIVEIALSPFTAEWRPQILIFNEAAVVVSSIAATSLTLALHELATNAIKYGALSHPNGLVRVSWSRPQQGAVALTWIEENGPPVRPPTRSGFGSTLISGALANLPGGSVRLNYQAAGVECVLSLPCNE